MDESPSVRFKSTAFSKYPTEDEEIVNPGRWGKRLAEYLRDRLPRFGVPTEDILSEDWGWLVNVASTEFPLWIGCGTVDGEEVKTGEPIEFVIFLSADVGLVHRVFSKPMKSWFRKVDTQPEFARVEAGLRQLIAASPDFQDVEWETVPAG